MADDIESDIADDYVVLSTTDIMGSTTTSNSTIKKDSIEDELLFQSLNSMDYKVYQNPQDLLNEVEEELIGKETKNVNSDNQRIKDDSDHNNQEVAVQIVNVDDSNNLQLNYQALENALLREDTRDKRVVVVSINGKFRQGKSFLLNFFRLYLEKQAIGLNDGATNWLNYDNIDKINGFEWRHSSKRVTTGMYMWHQPILCKLPNNDEVAVVLIDTQGLQDNATSPIINTSIFALSTMISSQQILNIHKIIGQNDIEQLKFVTQYTKYVMEDKKNEVPFQNFMFLVRDWIFEEDHAYGVEGGKKYLQEMLIQMKTSIPEELKQINNLILSCFENIDCYLFPYPGDKVANDAKFDGNLSDINSNFKDHVRILSHHLLHPSNLRIKQFSGKDITCGDLVAIFKNFFTVLQDGSLPEPKFLFEATAEATYQSAVDAILARYDEAMSKEITKTQIYMEEWIILQLHEGQCEIGRKSFVTYRKMNCHKIESKYNELLEKGFNQKLTRWQCENWKRMSHYLKKQLKATSAELNRAQRENLEAQVNARKCRDDLTCKMTKANHLGKKLLGTVDEKEILHGFMSKKEKEIGQLEDQLREEEEQLEENRKILDEKQEKLKEAQENVDLFDATGESDYDKLSRALKIVQDNPRDLWKKTSQVLNTTNLGMLANKEAVDKANSAICKTTTEASSYLYALLGIGAIGIAFIATKKSGAI